jgi:hypothetical protein
MAVVAVVAVMVAMAVVAMAMHVVAVVMPVVAARWEREALTQSRWGQDHFPPESRPTGPCTRHSSPQPRRPPASPPRPPPSPSHCGLSHTPAARSLSNFRSLTFTFVIFFLIRW